MSETDGIDNHLEDTLIHSGSEIRLKKSSYTGHCVAIWSVDHAIQILDRIGLQTDSEDCLPFALQLVEGGELIKIAEDNGEFSCGDILMESLGRLEGYNVLVCVSRNISGCFVSDMFQDQKFRALREAANSAVDVMMRHFSGGADEEKITEYIKKDSGTVKPARKPFPVSSIPLEMNETTSADPKQSSKHHSKKK